MDRERGREQGRGGRGKGKVGGVERNKSQEKFHEFQYCYSFGPKNSAAFRIPIEWKRVTESEKKKIDKRGYYSTVRLMS